MVVQLQAGLGDQTGECPSRPHVARNPSSLLGMDEVKILNVTLTGPPPSSSSKEHAQGFHALHLGSLYFPSGLPSCAPWKHRQCQCNKSALRAAPQGYLTPKPHLSMPQAQGNTVGGLFDSCLFWVSPESW